MRIALATDAWRPQVNGVVRALTVTADHLRGRGHEVMVIEPSRFWTIGCPTYPEIRLALACAAAVHRQLDRGDPDAVHVATEGPIGWATRNWCLKRDRRFTTSFHTRFPDYVSVRSGVPSSWGWAVMRRFHGPAVRTFTVTPTLAGELEARGIGRTYHWPLGVDLGQFHPGVPPHPALAELPRPILLSVGRIAPEKNLAAFLNLPVAGSKVVIGDGPELNKLTAAYPDALFLGARHGEELASLYTAADALVFPSRTDTFGLVNIEALACGLPVAAYPVPGPADIIGRDERGRHGGTGRLGAIDADLGKAVDRALSAGRRQPKRSITTGIAAPIGFSAASRCRRPRRGTGEQRDRFAARL